MVSRPLGKSGISLSVLGLGCNNFGVRLDAHATKDVVHAALDAGINHFDTADVYGAGESERMLGAALRDRREEAVIATKFGYPPSFERDGRARGRKAHLRESVEGSLRRLGLEPIDILYYHLPDRTTPIEETLEGMQDLVAEGKVRALACSNFSAPELEEAQSLAKSRGHLGFVATQDQYSLLDRGAEDELLPRCRELDVGFIPYFPLAGGMLTGKYLRDAPPPAGTRFAASPERTAYMRSEERFDRIGELAVFAGERGHSLHELAIAALVARSGVTSVILGASSPKQVEGNVKALEWDLDSVDLDEIPRVEGLGMKTI